MFYNHLRLCMHDLLLLNAGSVLPVPEHSFLFVSSSVHNDRDRGLYRLNVDWVVHLHTFISTATFTWEALSVFVQTGQEVFVIVDAWSNSKCPFDSCGFSDTLPLCAGHCSPTLLSRSQQCFLLRVCTPASEGVCFSTARLSSLFSSNLVSSSFHQIICLIEWLFIKAWSGGRLCICGYK